jgi:HD-GYP domain-containing protein (c-di-GMP phosphodiesterase class II)
MDRPYKRAASTETAFRILNEEAAAGLIDRDVVSVFIASGSYRLGAAGRDVAARVHMGHVGSHAAH